MKIYIYDRKQILQVYYALKAFPKSMVFDLIRLLLRLLLFECHVTCGFKLRDSKGSAECNGADQLADDCFKTFNKPAKHFPHSTEKVA